MAEIWRLLAQAPDEELAAYLSDTRAAHCTSSPGFGEMRQLLILA
jgi:hypothetical protein